jgi:hypothetical protein
MARRTFRYDSGLGSLVEVVPHDSPRFHDVIGDESGFTPFRSVYDGTTITSRSQLRKYMAERSLVHYDPHNKGEYDRYADERKDRAMRELLWEELNKTFSMGSKPRNRRR